MWSWHDWHTYAAIVIFIFVWGMIARNWTILPIGRTSGMGSPALALSLLCLNRVVCPALQVRCWERY